MKSLIIPFLLLIVGCAWFGRTIDTIAPNQVVNGVEVPGTHVAAPFTKDVADAIPFGSIALSALLLGVNFWQKVKANKLTAGLASTIQAIEAAGKDPAIASAIAQLKVALSNAHQIANVQPLINDLMAKLGFPADIKPIA